MNRILALLVGVSLAATGCGQQGASYGLGYAIQNGAGVLPPTASRGTTTMINYHEAGGIVARTLVLLMAASGLKNPDGDTTVKTDVKSERVGDTLFTTTTKTTTFTPTTPEERAAREAAITDFSQNIAPGIMHDAFPVEALDIGIASRSLGGDTKGGTFDMMGQLALGDVTAIALGFGYASLTYRDRTSWSVTDTGSTLMRTQIKGDLNYTFIGFPVRFTQGVFNRASVFLQWDLNVNSLTDSAASPFTIGFLYKLPVLTLKTTVTGDRFEAGAASFGLEAIVGI